MTAIEQSRIERLEKEIRALKKDADEYKEKLRLATERLDALQALTKKHSSPLQK